MLDFQLGPASDRIDVTGGTLTGPASGTVTLNLSDSGGFAAATYVLFDFTHADTSSFDEAISCSVAPSPATITTLS